MELSTFGAIFKFAIELEKGAAAYYEAAAREGGPQQERLAALARAHKKRQQLAEQMRREHVTEMILEPIYGLSDEDWRVDLSAGGWAKAAELESKMHGFYSAAAGKVSIPEVARRLRKMAQESEELEEEAQKLP